MVDPPNSRLQRLTRTSPLQRRVIGLRIAGISRDGFCFIAILVVVLWCLVVTNHLIVQHADAELSRAVRGLENLRLQNSAQPGKPYENAPNSADPRRRGGFNTRNNIHPV
jgi:hypothetical protein